MNNTLPMLVGCEFISELDSAPKASADCVAIGDEHGRHYGDHVHE